MVMSCLRARQRRWNCAGSCGRGGSREKIHDARNGSGMAQAHAPPCRQRYVGFLAAGLFGTRTTISAARHDGRWGTDGTASAFLGTGACIFVGHLLSNVPRETLGLHFIACRAQTLRFLVFLPKRRLSQPPWLRLALHDLNSSWYGLVPNKPDASVGGKREERRHQRCCLPVVPNTAQVHPRRRIIRAAVTSFSSFWCMAAMTEGKSSICMRKAPGPPTTYWS
jgi:hypothetical protein